MCRFRPISCKRKWLTIEKMKRKEKKRKEKKRKEKKRKEKKRKEKKRKEKQVNSKTCIRMALSTKALTFTMALSRSVVPEPR